MEKLNEAVYLINDERYLHLRENSAGVGFATYNKVTGEPLESGQQHLGFLVALALQKAFLYQFFDGSSTSSWSADALTLCILWHTVRASCFHRVQQSILGEVLHGFAGI